MRRGVLSTLLPRLWAPFVFLLCADASTVVQIVDAVVPDLLPTFPSEAFTPKYIVALQSESAPNLALEGVLPMKDKYGRPYSCSIPDKEEHDEPAQGASLLKDDQLTMQKDPSELLSALDSLCLYRIEDWWTYELCYKKHVRQFHKDSENSMLEYDLGQYDKDHSDLDTILDNGTLAGASSKYVRQVYSGGEACDITGKQRETEVHYVCSEEGKEGIKSIREHATCLYTLVFMTPRLCKHPGFQVPKQPLRTIVCNRLGGKQQGDGTAPARPLNMEQEAEGGLPMADSEGVTTEGGLKKVAPDVQSEDALEGDLDLDRASQAGTSNASAVEAALGQPGRHVEAEADQRKGHSRHQIEHSSDGGKEGLKAGEPSNEGKRDSSRAAPKSAGAVGPPSAAGARQADGEVYYEDAEGDKEDESNSLEDNDDEPDYSRTGMHAEL